MSSEETETKEQEETAEATQIFEREQDRTTYSYLCVCFGV